ncbi:hypothetical protein M0R45_009853 [Rubus argutus]|uniref:Uncharacterized protein n=1 Tax=Rubus argutus TaxID=59490 RepID=A0AAW1Y7U4_RUBAR
MNRCHTSPSPTYPKPQIPLSTSSNPGLPRNQLIQLLLVLLDSADNVDQHHQMNWRRRMATLVESSALEPSKTRFSSRRVPRLLVGLGSAL